MTTIIVHTSAASAVRHSCQHGWHRIEVDTSALTPEQRDLLANRVCERDGARYGRLYQGNVDAYDVAPPTVEGLVKSLQRELDERSVRDAREAEINRKGDLELEAALDEIAAMPVEDLVEIDYRGEPQMKGICACIKGYISPATIQRRFGRDVTAAEAVGKVAQAQVALAALVVARDAEKARVKRERAEEEAQGKRDAAREHDATVAWLRAHDHNEMAERAEADVLPSKELRRVVLDSILAPLGDPASFGRCQIDAAPDTYTAEQWARLCKITSMVEGLDESVSFDRTVVQTVREWVDDPENEYADGDAEVLGAPFLCAKVTVCWNGWEWSRRYRID